MKTLKHLSVAAAVSDIISEIELSGGVIIDGLLSTETVEQFNAEINPFLEKKAINHAHPNAAVEFFHGPQTKHLTGVAGVSDTFVNQVLLHPLYKAVGDEFLLPNCAEYILNIAHVLDRGPGAGDQLIHRDQDVWPKKLTSAIGGHVQFASLVALSEYTADMGATRLVPGSHLWPGDREPKPEETVIAEMAPGSAVIYLGSTLHGAGPNKTDKVRRGMHTSFCLGWLRTEENSYLSAPLERVRKMPRRAQELLGYGVHDGIANGEGFLGAVDNGIPVDMIAAGTI
ncbi:phytanoyl-CoA dioxygenase family protein [Pseudohalioglobus lutimaris]|uniref:Mitomycin antibiotic biosynthesis protein n=1 Tax=Pseudohalioglobus lutimaris TaxID=1737061 RepID=A0A2N5WYX5_9GAMM|nr:phytanoyl-CoA dioxygenase family protein [Pseudohalioglobus lutimaris]PLW67430.1 mitomycin antibiotic biosynthesis protein [Pseudohalioglobus lutimaris]